MAKTIPEQRQRILPSRAHLPYGLVLAAWWSACLLLIAGGAIVGARLVEKLAVVVAPLAIAVLFSAMLTPVVNFLDVKLRLPRSLASLVTVLGLIGLVSAGVTLFTTQLISGVPAMRDSAREGVNQIVDWLENGPFKLTQAKLSEMVQHVQGALSENSKTIADGAVRTGTTAVNSGAALLIFLITLFFFLYEGRRIWLWLVSLAPRASQVPMDEAFRRGWVSLGTFAHVQVLVAALNAVAVGIGCWVMKVPFAIPISVLVFIASFVPIVGALISGAVAALIGLVDQGLFTAIVMVIIVTAVNQIETHVLQPFLMGHAVALHPLAVIVVVAAGTYLFGLAGAVFSVPVAALVNSVVRYLRGNDMFPALGEAYELRKPGTTRGLTDPKDEGATGKSAAGDAAKDAAAAKGAESAASTNSTDPRE